jgi:hypothetical protein
MTRILNTLNSPATFILVLCGFLSLAWVSQQEKNQPYDVAGLIAVIESGDNLVTGKQWTKETQAAALLAVWEGK